MLVPWTGLVVKALPRMNFFNTCVVTYLAICEANHLSKIHLFTDWFHPAHIVFCFPQGTDAATRGVLYKKMFLFLWSGREKKRLWRRCFLLDFAEFCKNTLFLQSTSGRLLSVLNLNGVANGFPLPWNYLYLIQQFVTMYLRFHAR